MVELSGASATFGAPENRREQELKNPKKQGRPVERLGGFLLPGGNAG
jgi:hypothetical protein